MFAADHAATALLIKRRFPSVSLTPLLISVQAMELAWVGLNYLGVERTTTEATVRSVADIHLAYMPYSHSVATAAGAALLVFFFHPHLVRIRRFVLLLDAAGLGLFTATGTLKALDFGVPFVGACILGMVTGIGGGLLRDLLTGEIPVVLRSEIYAVASLAGAVAVALGRRLGAPGLVMLLGAAALTFAIRVTAMVRGWSAPIAKQR